MPASQEYRDGAAWGAWELARRIRILGSLGITAPPTSIIETMAGTIRYEMGGALPEGDAENV